MRAKAPRLRLVGLILALATAGGSPGTANAQDDKPLQKRIWQLIAAFADPEARGEKLKQTVAAKEELTKIGAPAAPQLIAALVEEPASSNISFTSGQVLLNIGKLALPAVMARWGDLTDGQRWRLMEFREKHDLEATREYVWNCVTNGSDEIRLKAWAFMMRHPDPRAKDRYLNALRGVDRGKGGEDPQLRWWLLPTKVIYDKEAEEDALIGLLKSDSWAAKGEGYPPPLGIGSPIWPEGRETIIDLLLSRKVTRAAPAMLKVLQEKGKGAGYLAEVIIPALVEFNFKDAIPELEEIANSKAVPEDPDKQQLAMLLRNKMDVQKLAVEAVKKLRASDR